MLQLAQEALDIVSSVSRTPEYEDEHYLLAVAGSMVIEIFSIALRETKRIKNCCRQLNMFT